MKLCCGKWKWNMSRWSSEKEEGAAVMCIPYMFWVIIVPQEAHDWKRQLSHLGWSLCLPLQQPDIHTYSFQWLL